MYMPAAKTAFALAFEPAVVDDGTQRQTVIAYYIETSDPQHVEFSPTIFPPC